MICRTCGEALHKCYLPGCLCGAWITDVGGFWHTCTREPTFASHQPDEFDSLLLDMGWKPPS